MGATWAIVDEAGAVKEFYDYYPFGKIRRSQIADLPVGKYKFTGKELDDENGLDWYDFGARYYDAGIGRWFVADPLAEKYPGLSPFVYSANNPNIFKDPNGKWVDTVVDAISLTISVNDVYNDPKNLKNWIALGGDVLGTVLPGVCGLGTAYRAADKGIDIVNAIENTGDLVNSGTKLLNAADETAGAGKHVSKTIDPNTGEEVGRFIVDPKGNTMIEPKGGTTVEAGKNGADTHTLYPNKSNYQRLNPQGHPGNPQPHGHGHLQGTGPNKKGQGKSIDNQGNVVQPNTQQAHWKIKE